MNRRHLALVLASAATVAVSALAVSRGYATDDAPPPSASNVAPPIASTGEPVAINIVDFAFDPESIMVAPGTSVIWTNSDSASHSVRSDDAKFTEQTMKTGATATATFAAPGTYNYICGLHPFMTATIVVA